MKTVIVLLLAALPLLSQAQGISFRPFEFQLIGDLKIKAERATLTVPENRQRASSNKIELAVVRLKSTAPHPGTPIVYLAGGPGGSGIAAARSQRYAVLRELQKIADVLLLDQRGTGQSKPSLELQTESPIPQSVLDNATDHPTSVQQMVERIKQAHQTLQKTGIDLNAYNTAENAEDIEDLRKALGTDKISLYGYSYGTHLGLAYLKKYDKNVSRCVFGGVNGLHQRYRYPSDADTIIHRIDGFIAQNPKLRKQIPDFSGLVRKVLQQLENQPVKTSIQVQGKPVSLTIFEADVAIACILNMGETAFIREMPQLFYQMSKGSFQRMAELCYQTIKRPPTGTMMTFTMHCASGVSDERLARVRSLVSSSIFGNAINYPFMNEGFCEAVQVQDLGNEFRQNVKTDVPTLFLSADLDGRTSINDAEEVLKGFSRSSHVIFHGVSHDLNIAESIGLITDFFNEKTIKNQHVTVENFEFYGLEEDKIRMQISQSLVQGEAYLQKTYDDLMASEQHLSQTFLIPLILRLLRERKVQEATWLAEISLRRFPNNAMILSVRGELYLATGQKEQAREVLQRSLVLNPMNLNAIRAMHGL